MHIAFNPVMAVTMTLKCIITNQYEIDRILDGNVISDGYSPDGTFWYRLQDHRVIFAQEDGWYVYE